MSTKYNITEIKLVEAIEKALRPAGRTYLRRANTSLQHDDKKSPNFFYWRFNPASEYSFPEQRLSRWSDKEYDACIKALEDEQVWVVAADGTTQVTPSSRNKVPIPSTQPDTNMSQTDPNLYTAEKLSLALHSDVHNARAPDSPTWNNSDVTSELDRLTTRLLRNAENYKNQQAEDMNVVLALVDLIKVKLQKTDVAQLTLSAKLSFFEEQIQQKMRDCEDLKKSLRHFEEGDAIRREDPDNEASFASAIEVVVKNLERSRQLPSRHNEELKKAREEGYNEGRESIVEEYEAVAAFQERYNLPTSGRKIRELKTVVANWKGVPQELFSATFLPEGKVPGNKTLYLLAKLSKLLPDGRKALSLLKKEIDQRNRLHTGSSPHSGLTNTDVSAVLSRLQPGTPSTDDQENPTFSETASLVNRGPLSAKISSTHQSAPTIDNLLSVRQGDSDKRHGTTARNEFHTASNQGKSSAGNSNSQKRIPSLANHTETVSQHHKLTSNPDSQNPILEEPNTQLRKSARQSQSANTQLTSGVIAVPPDFSSMPAGADGVSRGIFRTSETLEQILATIPPPPKAEVLSATEYLPYLPTDFVLKHIGGSQKAFSRMGARSNITQVVNWEWTIKIKPESHLNAPRLGTHGALHFVDGQDGTGEVGKIYPVLVNSGKAGYQYIGHYKVEKQVTMPLEAWQNWPEERRNTVAKLVEETNWGRNIISDRGLCFKPKGSRESQIEDILSFFNRRAKPCMRMKWTILRLESFNQHDCRRLREALQLYGRKGGKVQPWDSKLPQTVAVNHENTDRSVTNRRLAVLSHSETRSQTENVIPSGSADRSLPPLSQTYLIQQLEHSKKRPHSANDSDGAYEIRPAKRMALQFTPTQNGSSPKSQSIPNTTQDTKSLLKNAFGLSTYLKYTDEDPEDIYNASPPRRLRGSQQSPAFYSKMIRVEIPPPENLNSRWRPRRWSLTELEEGETADHSRTDVNYQY